MLTADEEVELMLTDAPSPLGECFNCSDECDGDNYCFGCECYVCDPCNAYALAPGGHINTAHLQLDEEGDDDHG